MLKTVFNGSRTITIYSVLRNKTEYKKINIKIIRKCGSSLNGPHGRISKATFVIVSGMVVLKMEIDF